MHCDNATIPLVNYVLISLHLYSSQMDGATSLLVSTWCHLSNKLSFPLTNLHSTLKHKLCTRFDCTPVVHNSVTLSQPTPTAYWLITFSYLKPILISVSCGWKIRTYLSNPEVKDLDARESPTNYWMRTNGHY